MRNKAIAIALGVLIVMAYLGSPLAYASIIIKHKIFEGYYGNMQVFIYAYKDEDDDPNEDFYALQIRVHAKNTPGHMYTELEIYSPEGICDRWEPTAGKKGGTFGFSYGKTISFSVTVPEAYISVEGVNAHDIRWVVSPCEDIYDIDFGAGFYVPQGSPFSWEIKVHVLCYTIVLFCIVKLWEDYINHPLGDINVNGKVDTIDVGIVFQALGSYPGQPNWNSDCDLNCDGKVNWRDLSLEFGYYLRWQTRHYTYAPPVGATATAFGQAINTIRQKYP
jgi:hypothetical protein